MAHVRIEVTTPKRQAAVAVQSKLLLLLAVLSTVIVSTNLAWLLGVGGFFLLLTLLRRQPVVHVVTLAVLPAVTALWLGLAGMGGGTGPIVLATRAAVAAIAAYSVISLASFIEWLLLLQTLIPGLLLDALYLSMKGVERGTQRFQSKLSALRLRGVDINPFSKDGLGLLANCLGGVLLEAWDDAEEAGNMLALRGYRPGLFSEPVNWRFCASDLVVWLLAAGFLTGGIIYGAH